MTKIITSKYSHGLHMDPNLTYPLATENTLAQFLESGQLIPSKMQCITGENFLQALFNINPKSTDAQEFYFNQIKQTIFDAYINDPKKINEIADQYFHNICYSSNFKVVDQNDKKLNDSIERGIGMISKKQKEYFRKNIIKDYAQKGFLDITKLKKGIISHILESEIGIEPSLIGALTNKLNEENAKVRTRMIETMLNTLGYCPTCADATINYFNKNYIKRSILLY